VHGAVAGDNGVFSAVATDRSSRLVLFMSFCLDGCERVGVGWRSPHRFQRQ
jgi:hypothetical protein